MGARIAAYDWSGSLGAIETWPGSLRTTVGLLLHSSVPIVLLWGEDGVMIYNDAYSVFAGGRHPELLGSKVREGWPEVAAFNDNVMRVGLAGGTLAYKDQVLVLNRTGKAEQAWMNLDYSPVIDETGAPGGVIAIVVETTERVPAERRQLEATERQRQQFEQAPGFIIVMEGPEHVVAFVNNAHRRVFASDGWEGMTIREAFPSIADQGFYEILDQVYATGEAVEFEAAEVRYRRVRDGPEETRHLTFVYAPILDVTGVVSGVFCEGFDVTEAHKANVALRELNTDLERKVVERTQARALTWQVSPDLMGALNSQGYFETSNPAWQTILGWSEAEVASTSIFELLHPDDLERTREGFALTQIGQPAIRFPNRYRCKDGSYRWISWVGVPEEGMVYCTGRDITEEKAAEVELAAAQEALRQAQKMEAVGQLTGGLAHDFNNLLAGISGSLEMLEKRIGEGRLSGAERYITAAQSGARRAAALTQRLLAFARRQTLDPKPTDINRLIGGMEDLIRRTVGPTVELEVVGAGGLWMTRVDASQLESSLLNLCLNGRDAMAPDGGRLTIETANKWLDERAARERELPPGQYVSLCVTDTGTGMDAETMARAFDPFFTTKPLGQGTGLGLSMTYGFVRQSGGQVRIYSEIGKGTTMCLYLPRYAGAMDEADESEPAAAVDRGDGETVLVIDDEPTVRMLIVEVLEENGYSAIEAADGPSGLRVLQSDARIDLLISDVGLPGGLNGRQIADAARQTRPNLKVLFITGYAENAAVGNGHLDAGMEIVTKPFAIATLGAKIRELIDR
ncbi:PAS domain-containing protein [Phenylobacterium sp.]|uniref:PAS domain-containing protein n=1 Tax=Phenylobacterium sp. TaxID=1871053 RepID=UPI0011FD6C57|nr:PAS domain-containing protein [Phenylobacterium sp.]THD59754.1 MAG: PAS domain S-box protein [Phenylobacterium sp.]